MRDTHWTHTVYYRLAGENKDHIYKVYTDYNLASGFAQRMICLGVRAWVDSNKSPSY